MATPLIEAGSPYYVKIQITDEVNNVTPPSPAPASVKIYLRDPTTTTQVNGSAMSMNSDGTWYYTYTTPSSPSADQIGIWMVQFEVYNSASSLQDITVWQAAFSLTD